MLVVQAIRQRNHSVVEPIVARLVSTDQQDRRPTWVKREERADRSATMLRAKFLHVLMPRALEPCRHGGARDEDRQPPGIERSPRSIPARLRPACSTTLQIHR